ncbi:hypothetical protein, partial [Streptococcus ruminantium]|uniref:hypothetical protein n=1 Tax=Streptococcus ruminantium TaxID=1917441 RepID=UPI001D13E442
MKLLSNDAALMNVILLTFLIITLVFIWVNKNCLNRYSRKKIRISNDLDIIFQQFCETEGLDKPLIVYSDSFWFRPLTNTIGVKNLKTNALVDALAFLHELYHFKDRNRVLKVQTVVSVYTYLLSTLLKVVTLYSIWFGTSYPILRLLVTIDMIMLLVCLIFTLIIESYASNGAISFLKNNNYIDQTNLVGR